jgi:hypothetical protein
MRRGAQHAVLRKGIPFVLVVVAFACSDAATVGGVPPSPSLRASIPPLPLGNMHETDSTKTAEQASIDATDSQAMQTILEGAGLLGVRERVYTGGRGSYSRVVVRAWGFVDTQGAGAFHDWLITDATHSVIGDAKPVPTSPIPGLFVHEPSGCCHEETPIYLAAWQNGDVVWTVVASGPRIQTQPVIELVKKIEQEV